jgi:tryptophan halogenase
VLREYVGPCAHGRSVRTFAFEAGYRETSWYKNCVAVGLAAGFFEPLEATGIVFIEAAANLLAELFPWDGEFEAAARQFNRITKQRYERAHDFLKMHYCLSQRRDSSFWRDNVLAETIPDSLKGLLERWHFRPPDGQDFDLHVNSFGDSSWQFVLYGMGYKTDLSAKAGAFRHHEQARKEFAEIGREAARAAEFLPSHRELIDQVYQSGFARSTAG